MDKAFFTSPYRMLKCWLCLRLLWDYGQDNTDILLTILEVSGCPLPFSTSWTDHADDLLCFVWKIRDCCLLHSVYPHLVCFVSTFIDINASHSFLPPSLTITATSQTQTVKPSLNPQTEPYRSIKTIGPFIICDISSLRWPKIQTGCHKESLTCFHFIYYLQFPVTND